MNKHIICKHCNRTFIIPEWEQNVYNLNKSITYKECARDKLYDRTPTCKIARW